MSMSKSKSNSMSNSMSKYKSKSKSNSTHKSLLDLIKHISASRSNMRKSQNNLPVKLMKINKKQSSTSPRVFSKSFSKSRSSAYSSIVKNGKIQTHRKGKEIINNSTKPFIQIKEMNNGDIHHYIVPKNTISYK